MRFCALQANREAAEMSGSGSGSDSKAQQPPKKNRNDVPGSPLKQKPDINSTLETILKRIAEVHELALSTKKTTDRMELELTAIRADIYAANNRISAVEQRVSDIEDAKLNINRTLGQVTQSATTIHRQMAKFEDRNRRGNIRILGVPEGEEEKVGSITTLIETRPSILTSHIESQQFNRRLGRAEDQ